MPARYAFRRACFALRSTVPAHRLKNMTAGGKVEITFVDASFTDAIWFRKNVFRDALKKLLLVAVQKIPEI